MDDFKVRLDRVIKEMDNSLKRNKIQMRPIVSFPKKNVNGLLIKLFLWILRKSGGIADLKFYDLK